MPAILLGDAIGNAITRTGDLLFRPFRFKKWRNIAVCAMLTLLGGSPPFVNFSDFRRPGAAPPAPMTFDDVKNFFDAHLAAIVIVGTIGFLLLLTIYLVGRWLNSRGQFMLFHNVVTDDDLIAQPWRDYKSLGNSLFKFRLLWDLLIFNVLLVIGAIGLAIAWADIRSSLIAKEFQFNGASVAAAIFCAVAVLLAGLVLWIVGSVIFDLAVSVMYVRQMRAWPAIKVTWRELFWPHLGSCLLFFLFLMVVRIVRGIWAMIAVLLFSLLTCCIGYLLLIIPIVGTYVIAFLCLPTLAFEQALKLQFISQFGNEYNVVWRTAVGGGFPVILNPVAPEPPSDAPRIY